MNPPHYVSKDSPDVQRLIDIFAAYTGERLPALAIGGGTYLHHIEGGVSFGCEFPGYDYNMHGADRICAGRSAAAVERNVCRGDL